MNPRGLGERCVNLILFGIGLISAAWTVLHSAPLSAWSM